MEFDQIENMEDKPTKTSRVFIFAQLNPLSANPTKWSNTLKQFVGKLLTN